MDYTKIRVNMMKICGSRRYNSEEDRIIIKDANKKIPLEEIANKLNRTEEAICLRIRKHYSYGPLNKDVMGFYNKQYYRFRYKENYCGGDSKENNNHREREKCTLEEKFTEYISIFEDTDWNREIIFMILKSTRPKRGRSNKDMTPRKEHNEKIEEIYNKYQERINNSNYKNGSIKNLANLAYEVFKLEKFEFMAKRISLHFKLGRDPITDIF